MNRCYYEDFKVSVDKKKWEKSVCLHNRDKRQTEVEREKEREGASPPYSCFSLFSFMLGPSFSLGATDVAFISNSQILELRKAVFLACISPTFLEVTFQRSFISPLS